MKIRADHARIRRYLTPLAALSLLLAACGGSAGGEASVSPPPEEDAAEQTSEGDEETSGEPVMLGGAVDETAYLADFDGPMIAGIELAIEEVNANGGVLDGRPLEITFQDMEADPQQGVRVVQRLIQGNVAAILHGFTSASTRAVQPILEQNEVPMMTASVLPDEEDFVFTTIVQARFETGVRLDYLREHGITTVGVLQDGTPYSELQLGVLQEAVQESDLEIAGVEQHANDAVDLRPQITALLQAGADAIVKLSAGPTTIVAASALAQAGSDAPLVSGIDSLNTSRQAHEAYGNFFTVASGPQVFDALPDDERSESLTSFVELFDESGLDVDPTYTGRGWDSVFLLVEAIETAGSVEGPAIAEALESMGPFVGASGTYEFTEESHYGFDENPFRVVRFVDDDGVEIVFTPNS
jgi:branched-chain amino acid transport system substrate-binding protein